MKNIGAHGIDILYQDPYPYKDLAHTSNTLLRVCYQARPLPLAVHTRTLVCLHSWTEYP